MQNLFRFSFHTSDCVRHHAVYRGGCMETLFRKLKEETEKEFGYGKVGGFLMESSQGADESILESWIPVYTTGVPAVRRDYLSQKTWVVVSQYNRPLTEHFRDLSEAIEIAYEKQKEIFAKYTNKEDAPQFK